MSDIILTTNNLTKKYNHTLALDNINLNIERGRMYGFIGQNGAGKTTLIRLIVGLSFPTSGELYLFGKTGKQALQEQRKRIGCMVETPALYPNMTAVQNLEVQRIQRGIPDRHVIRETLELVGLDDYLTGRKAVRNFSLGMRQRLGIAIALLHDPELLILDEPINGLDPMGIAEMRILLKRLNAERGTTILISSHILNELYQTVSQYILINQGVLIEELTQSQLNEKCKRHIALQTNHVENALLALENRLHIKDYQVMPDGTIKLYDHLDDMEGISSTLMKEGVLITGMTMAGDTLESYFLHRIGGEKHALSH
ncbi:ATP-binding cassette domain-containing protein [Paenibacillus sp. LMG 31459]|uniref:ATP-binding cassette domain-containing protein n=1 Tax=Paenibacillus phytohabitans TaxID=2654978 RepID=A0ABX1YRI3_9BACL|nr:ATP-binding cassette domain-containing protein [Paenibacillus phytohabitans]NOU83698.1 ATP-binding cassette domain-containing protein [Paenibacillus phytohabitans]